MNGFFDFIGRVLRGVFSLALGLAALVFVLSLLLASLVVVLGASLWALLTGRSPRPVAMFSRFRQSSQRFAPTWPPRSGGQGHSARPSAGDVVDVQATEVPDAPAAGRDAGPDRMARASR